MPKVVYEFASKCSMSLTVVVSARSNGVMMRPAIWSGGNPWYCQATPMIGMLMPGKISTGMRSAASVPMRRMSRAATTNVYGRLSAMRTMASMGAPENHCLVGGGRQRRRGGRMIGGILGRQATDGGPVKLLAALVEEPQK